MKKFIQYLVIILCLLFAGCTTEPVQTGETQSVVEQEDTKETKMLSREEYYTTKEDVALYLYTYGTLPVNFMTKKEAKALGWSGGGLDEYADGYCIGGDRFGNYEGILPEKEGRQYYECDIGTMHQEQRGACRLVFSNDGLIYYTQDHYNSFELLYEDAEISLEE